MLRTRLLAAGYVVALLEQDPKLLPEERITHIGYTCPSGVRAILRDVRVSVSNATYPVKLDVKAGRDAGFYPLARFHTTGPENQIQGTWMDAVLEPGDTLQLTSDAAAITYWLSGAEMTIPA